MEDLSEPYTLCWARSRAATAFCHILNIQSVAYVQLTIDQALLAMANGSSLGPVIFNRGSAEP